MCDSPSRFYGKHNYVLRNRGREKTEMNLELRYSVTGTIDPLAMLSYVNIYNSVRYCFKRPLQNVHRIHVLTNCLEQFVFPFYLVCENYYEHRVSLSVMMDVIVTKWINAYYDV